ncbi:asparaginase [Streptomyces lydicus]|nr:asparaginase [Streptomyces lydicus]
MSQSSTTLPPHRTAGAPPVVREPAHVPVAHVVRGGLVEGVHHGSVVVLAADGSVEFQAGDIEAAFYPRSALKPLQAVGLLRAGCRRSTTRRWPWSRPATRRGTASGHRPAHPRRRRAGRGPAAQRPDLPYDPAVRDEWIGCGLGPTRLAQNCSGKHAAMLLTARTRGWRLDDYLDPGHPLQQELAAAVADLTGQGIARVTVDGCGAPLFAVSLHGLTRAAARLATAAPAPARAGSPTPCASTRRWSPAAAGTWPAWCGRCPACWPGRLRGVQIAALPDGRAVGVKIADGADRARMPVTAAALAHCGIDPGVLAPFAATPVIGGGAPVGTLRATDALTPHGA